MPTQAQITANRANALLSTGPATPAGLQISSRNSRGPVAAFLCITTENEQDFKALQQGWFDYFQPQGEVESNLVDEIVIARWRQQRIWVMETVTLNKAMKEIVEDEPEANYSPEVLQGLAAIGLAENSKTWATLQRYERECRRTYERAVKELRQIQAERKASEQPPQPALAHPDFFRALESIPAPVAAMRLAENEPNFTRRTPSELAVPGRINDLSQKPEKP